MRPHRAHRAPLGHLVSIHAPWEGCDPNERDTEDKQHVSIHAPWEGCDASAFGINISLIVSFNSRTLGRVRLGRYSKLSDDRMFQFTHPGKGATRPLRTLSGVLYVSIHAPWEGCDREWLKFGVATICFNSRTLGRVRRERAIRSILTCKFQFTHPGKGATRVDCL